MIGTNAKEEDLKMTVFNFVNLQRDQVSKDLSGDALTSAFATNPPRCLLCREFFSDGQRVMYWSVHSGADDLHFHADCVKQYARGLLKDIAECTR